MLHINELSYRIDGRLILDGASAVIPSRHKVGLVGRNGAGKSTLLRLILGDAVPESGSVAVPRHARIGTVAQEAPSGEASLLDAPWFNHRVAWQGGVLAGESAARLQAFFQARR